MELHLNGRGCVLRNEGFVHGDLCKNRRNQDSPVMLDEQKSRRKHRLDELDHHNSCNLEQPKF